MKNINNLTLGNLYYIRDVATPASKLKISPDNMDKIMRGKCLILGIDFQSIACWSCSARAEFKIGASVLDQYGQAVLDRIAELESAESAHQHYYVDNIIERLNTVVNHEQEYNENDNISDDVIVEKTIDSEYNEETQTLSETTVKRGRKKSEI